MRKLEILVVCHLLLTANLEVDAATTALAVSLVPSPSYSTTTATNIAMVGFTPTNVVTITVANDHSSGNCDCTCSGVLAPCALCLCGLLCSCQNPCGATYQCTLDGTTPASAASKLSWVQSTTVSSNTDKATSTICILRLNSALNTGEYNAADNSVTFSVTVKITQLKNAGDSQCNSGYDMTESGNYKFTIVPVPTTTSTTSTSTTTRTSTSTSTSTATSTSTTTRTSTSTTTRTTTTTTTTTTPTTTYTTTAFIQSPGGIATVTLSSIIGAVLLALALYYLIKSCSEAAVDRTTDALYTIRNDTGYSYYNVGRSKTQPKPTEPQTDSNDNYTVKTSYTQQNFPTNGTPSPSFAKTHLTPVKF